MKIALIIIFSSVFVCSSFAYYFFSKKKSTSRNCFNESHFHLCHIYLQWKYTAAKKISKYKRVILEDSYDMDYNRNPNEKKSITFYKNNLPVCIITSDGIETMGEGKNKIDINQCNRLFCELYERAKFKNLGPEQTRRFQ